MAVAPADPFPLVPRSWRHGSDWAKSARRVSAKCCLEVGDTSYPFIAIVEGEVAVLDTTGKELVRHGPFYLPRRSST